MSDIEREDSISPENAEWQVLLTDILKRLPAYLKLGWGLVNSPDLPRKQKAHLLGGVLYSLSPVDLVPGLVPVLGQIDDLAMLLWGIRSALRQCPPEEAARLLDRSGLTEEQLEQDFRSLWRIAREFSRVVAKGAWRGGRKLAIASGRGIASGSRALWNAYRNRRR